MAMKYPPDAAVLAMLTITGLPNSRARITAFQTVSEATYEPPGLSSRNMMALMFVSFTAFTDCGFHCIGRKVAAIVERAALRFVRNDRPDAMDQGHRRPFAIRQIALGDIRCQIHEVLLPPALFCVLETKAGQ